MKTNKIVAKIEINLVYSVHDETTEDEVRSTLELAADTLASQGLLIPENSNLEIDSLDYGINIKKSKD